MNEVGIKPPQEKIEKILEFLTELKIQKIGLSEALNNPQLFYPLIEEEEEEEEEEEKGIKTLFSGDNYKKKRKDEPTTIGSLFG